MNFSEISNAELLGRLEKLARTERKITHLILWHINEVESRRLYAELGFDSMFRYLTQFLNYSEDSAYRRLSAARLLKQVPQVAEKIESGRITLTQMAQVQTALKLERKSGHVVSAQITQQIIEHIEDKSSFETKKILAQELNLPVETRQTLTPQRDNSVRMEITFTQEQMEMLDRAKDLLSHIVPDGNWAEVMTYLAERQIQKVMGKNRNLGEQRSNEFSVDESIEVKSTQSFLVARKRSPIKITTKRRVLGQAQNCCEYIDENTKQTCRSTYQLQIDHRMPFALGGDNSFENLRVLCRTHNLLEAKNWGLDKYMNG